MAACSTEGGGLEVTVGGREGLDESIAVAACFGRGSVGKVCGGLRRDISPGNVFLAKKTSGPISGSDSLSLASSAWMTASIESLRHRMYPGCVAHR